MQSNQLNPQIPENEKTHSSRKPYSSPAIIYSARLEATATACNGTGGKNDYPSFICDVYGNS
jgi:hypothetical protein